MTPPKISPARLTLRLEMDLADAGKEGSSERAGFDKDLYNDLARASNQPASLFLIKNLSPGSIIVDVDIFPDSSGNSKEPSVIAQDLERQAKDPNSLLRSGKLSSCTSTLLVVPVPSTDFSARKGRTPVGIQFSSRSSVSQIRPATPCFCFHTAFVFQILTCNCTEWTQCLV